MRKKLRVLLFSLCFLMGGTMVMAEVTPGYYRIHTNAKYGNFYVAANSDANTLKVATSNKYIHTIFYWDGKSFCSYSNGGYLQSVESSLTLGNDPMEWIVTGSAQEGYFIQLPVDVNTTNRLNVSKKGGLHLAYGTVGTGGTGKFFFEPVPSLKVNIGTTGYATFYSPVSVTLPEGIHAYIITAQSLAEGKITFDEKNALVNNTIPAATAVVLYGAPSSYELAVDSASTAVAPQGNLLKGTVCNSEILAAEGHTCYVLGVDKTDGIGFYKSGVNNTLNHGHKAYLELPNEVAAHTTSLRFDNQEGDATDIRMPEVANDATEEIYDLFGRRVQEITAPGMYIKGGKKFIVK